MPDDWRTLEYFHRLALSLDCSVLFGGLEKDEHGLSICPLCIRVPSDAAFQKLCFAIRPYRKISGEIEIEESNFVGEPMSYGGWMIEVNQLLQQIGLINQAKLKQNRTK